jgi:hypothetical protein
MVWCSSSYNITNCLLNSPFLGPGVSLNTFVRHLAYPASGKTIRFMFCRLNNSVADQNLFSCYFYLKYIYIYIYIYMFVTISWKIFKFLNVKNNLLCALRSMIWVRCWFWLCAMFIRISWSSSSCSDQGVGRLVDPFLSHASRSLFSGLPWFLLPFWSVVFYQSG